MPHSPLLFYIPLALLILLAAYMLLKSSPSEVATRLLCAVRRLFRRWSWAYLFLLGLALYPFQYYWQVRYQVSQASSGDAADVAAASAAKMVDTLQVFSKFSIAVGVFCLVNFLAWGALNLAIPVLPDWAKGDYRDAKAGFLPTPGFKGTFLNLSGNGRMGVYLAAWGFELATAAVSVYAAFSIQ